MAFEGRKELFCSYCGARLRVKTGASGSPMAVLDGIKEDTSLLARQSAYAHLEKEVEGLLAEREGLREQWQKLKAADAEQRAGCAPLAGLGLLGLGLVCIAAGLSDSAWGSVTLGLLLVVNGIGTARGFWHERNKGGKERARAREAIKERLAEIDERIIRCRERMEAIKADIERSIGEL